MIIKCQNCGKCFKIRKYRIGIAKYCSIKCRAIKQKKYKLPFGLSKTHNGYIVKRIKGKGYYYHRCVMEKYLDRKLKKDEVVHHIDNNKNNNSIENLKLFKGNSQHKKLDMLKVKRDKKGRFCFLSKKNKVVQLL